MHRNKYNKRTTGGQARADGKTLEKSAYGAAARLFSCNVFFVVRKPRDTVKLPMPGSSYLRHTVLHFFLVSYAGELQMLSPRLWPPPSPVLLDLFVCQIKRYISVFSIGEDGILNFPLLFDRKQYIFAPCILQTLMPVSSYMHDNE